MQIECPNCAARYEIPSASIGANGRKVRCAKCGHSWQQMPEGAAAPAPAPQPKPAPRPAPQPTPPQPDPAPPPSRQSVTDALDSLGDPPPPAGFEDGVDLDRPGADLDIDQDAPARRSRVGGFLAGQRGKSPATGSSARGRRRTTGGKPGTPILALVVLLVLGLLAVAVVARDTVARLVPPLGALYSAVGLSVDAGPMLPPGDPNPLFAVRDLQSEVLPGPEGGQVLIVRGMAENRSETAWRVPPIQVTLTDGDGAVLDVAVVEAARPSVEPGRTVPFEAVFENPDPATAVVDVVLVPSGAPQ